MIRYVQPLFPLFAIFLELECCLSLSWKLQYSLFLFIQSTLFRVPYHSDARLGDTQLPLCVEEEGTKKPLVSRLGLLSKCNELRFNSLQSLLSEENNESLVVFPEFLRFVVVPIAYKINPERGWFCILKFTYCLKIPWSMSVGQVLSFLQLQPGHQKLPCGW